MDSLRFHHIHVSAGAPKHTLNTLFYFVYDFVLTLIGMIIDKRFQ